MTLRGVKVGRVEAIRLVENEWVETEFSIDRSVVLPRNPAVISASASLFGEWTANIVPFEPLPVDPNLRNALIESDQAGGEAWPGATLPDIGQLTAQASRIAGDVADVTQRIGQAFDSTALKNLQQSVKDLAAISGPSGEVRPCSNRPNGSGRARTSRTPRMPSPAWRGHSRGQWPGWTPPPTTISCADILEQLPQLQRRHSRRGCRPALGHGGGASRTRPAWCGWSRQPTR